MGVLLLVRHGQASFGAADYDVLSGLGEQQAADLAPVIADLGPTAYVHGTLRRQRRTAEVATTAAGWTHPGIADAGWNELDTLSLFAAAPTPLPEGASHEEFQTLFESSVDRWTEGAHDGEYDETWPAFQARVWNALASLVELADGGDAVVFTSGGPIAATVTTLLAAGPATYRRLLPVVVNASVTRIVSGRRGLSLVGFNDHAHLPRSRLTYR